ncbi:MAG: hypothetical protein CSA66_04005 [Proteobacteria bacterium]|nr:MAG: hypothetical protein CSA66_04005 [Pseudomonadota bacterium]
MATFYEIRTPDADQPWDGQGLPAGPRAAMVGLIGLLAAIAAPYLVVLAAGDGGDPDGDGDQVLAKIADLRAWIPGDELPFEKMFSIHGAGPAVAEAGGSKAAAVEDPPITAVAGEGDELEPVELLVDPDPDPVAPAPVDANSAAALPPGAADASAATATDAAAATDAADASAAAPDAAATSPDPFARIAIPDRLWEGVTAEIEDPSGAMAPFYESLARTALKEEGAVTRIAQWGDSAIAADGMTSMARRLLQRQFGDAGHGFSLVAAGTPWYLRKDIEWTSRGFKSREFIRKQAKDGRYGYGGVAGVGYLGAHASWATVDEGPVGRTAGAFELWYHKGRGHGRLQIQVDGQERVVLDTSAEAPEDARYRLTVEDGPHTFKIRNVGGGVTRVYGAVVEREVPGVVYDSIGVVGARAARQLFADEAHTQAQLAQRDLDLMVFMYGGNALPDSTRLEAYQASFLQVLQRFRAGAPDAACLVMSPLDHGERRRGRIRTVPRMYDLMKAQKAAAFEAGCAWYSIFDAMGGEGAIGRWYNASPRLAASDLAHPTGRGSKVLGRLWHKSLMKGFAGWLKARKAAAPP